MNAIINVDAEANSIEQKITSILSMMPKNEFDRFSCTIVDKFGLIFEEVESHPYNIKTIIRGKKFTFAKGVSPASRTFMILHSLGHYYFICEANRKNIQRYSYIYDQRGKETSLHYYDTQGTPGALHNPQPISDQLRKDRVSFEIGANNFAIELLSKLNFGNVADLVRSYQIGDINYILDVTAGGKSSIVPSDHDYLSKYICADLSISQDDTFDNGVFEPVGFSIDLIDWQFLSDIDLEIHFF